MMEITKQRLVEIIKEEYQNILNEKTVRLGSIDIRFQSNDQAQIVGMKGKLPISKNDAKGLLLAIGKEFGIR
jgi:hypothetical protein